MAEGNSPTIHFVVFRRRGAGGLPAGEQECPRFVGQTLPVCRLSGPPAPVAALDLA